MIDEKKLISAFAENDLYLPEVVERLIKSQPKIGGWIPCSERLPDKDGKYICTQKIYNLSNVKLSGKSVELVEFYNGKWRRAKHLKVIAWQPLPEAYHEYMGLL